MLNCEVAIISSLELNLFHRLAEVVLFAFGGTLKLVSCPDHIPSWGETVCEVEGLLCKSSVRGQTVEG